MAKHLDVYSLLAVIGVIAFFLFLPKILRSLERFFRNLERNKDEKIREASHAEIMSASYKTTQVTLSLSQDISRRKLKKILRQIESQMRGEILFLKDPAAAKRSFGALFSKRFYFTDKGDIDLFVKSACRFLKPELKQVTK